MTRYHTLTEDAVRKLNSLIRKDKYQPPRRSHNTRPYDAGGGGSIWQGNLIDLVDGTGDFTGKKVGTVKIVVPPPDRAEMVDEEVEVVDWSECVFDLALADLDGVWVWFTEGVGPSQDPGAAAGQVTEPHYVTVDRCCVDGA